ncbi:myosin-4-like isoform X2 [Malus domestica]|uniref:myosin-4-like isoform X2 n=1 Tax=Malus domestica TaxID=3750 RepID=UPI00049878BC|nr:myosin-2-like isoform X2 [Malus domestica]
MLSLLAAVLWLGNISFQAIDNEKHVEVLADEGNCCKKVGKCCTGRSISILGIYGFESFQQHFNRQLYKLEQEECELDGVDWTKVDFQDNQECLNLFEKTSLSVARRSFASDNTAGQPGRLGSVSSPCYDSEEATSLGPGTPGASTPFNGAGCQANGSSNAVSNLLREFEQ